MAPHPLDSALLDTSIFVHPSFLVFVGAQVGAAVALLLATEWLHRRAARRGVDVPTLRRSRRFTRISITVLFAVGALVYLLPSYHPLLGEAKLREAYAALEADDAARAKPLLAQAAAHLDHVARSTGRGGMWGAFVERFVRPWGGRRAVLSALGTAHYLLGDCSQALPYLRRELRSRPSRKRTALLSFRVASCLAGRDRPVEAEDALLEALLIDRRYKRKAKHDPRLRPIAEALLSKRL